MAFDLVSVRAKILRREKGIFHALVLEIDDERLTDTVFEGKRGGILPTGNAMEHRIQMGSGVQVRADVEHVVVAPLYSSHRPAENLCTAWKTLGSNLEQVRKIVDFA
jgi:hypothetical protein